MFFQINKRGRNNEDYKYVIHDLMHDVCQAITKDECFCLENGYSKVSPDIRYVSVFRKKLKKNEENELCKYKKLLSLKVAHTNSCSINAITNWCNELTNIRSLSLTGCKIKNLPENIGNLEHLQFLDISGTNIETLPDSFCRLYNLQYLNMDDCFNIKYFPKRFNNLVSLLFLSLPLGKVHLVEHIENIFEAIQLYNLRVDLRLQKIEDLKNICKLSGSLTIIGPQNIPCKEAAEEAQLNTKPLIECLRLFWLLERGHTGDQLVSNQHHDEEVLHGLCPNPDLKELRIDNFRGRNLSPRWLKEEFLPFLTEVHFEGCKKASTISHFPRSITKLTISGCTKLTNLQNCLEPNHLPALKHIEIHNCPNLESLPVESFGGFVSLEYLKIDYCRKLRSQNAIVLPPYLKSLDLRYCGDLEKSIPSCLQNLTSLEKLSISDFKHLVSIPSEVTSNLKSLSMVNFYNCRMLQSLGGLQFLISLQRVYILFCPKLEETRGQTISGTIPQELLEGYLP